MFTVASTDEFDQWFSDRERDVADEVVSVLRLLRERGPQLGRPHADTLNGSKFHNMKELRVKTASAQVRIAFAFDPRREAILLVAGNKCGVSEKRFYRQLIARAEALYERHLRGVIHG